MSGDKGDVERVDWVLPIAEDVPAEKLNPHALAKAHELHSIETEIDPTTKRAKMYQEVVKGMPGPRQEKWWKRFFGLKSSE